jgi:uncharacterized protein YjbJ (UPF0337 family)
LGEECARLIAESHTAAINCAERITGEHEIDCDFERMDGYLQKAAADALVAHDFVLMKSSTKDKIKGAFREAKGKVKEKAGKVAGDPDLRDRGTMEKAGGKVQRKIGDVKKVFEQ